MANIRECIVEWAGLTGLPGVSVFYSGAAVDITVELATFFTSIQNQFPNGMQWTIPAAGDVLDEASGDLVSDWSGGTGAVVNGTGGSATYAAGVGAMVRWNTPLVFNSRRMRGRTFLTHMSTAGYQSDGTLLATTRTVLQNAATALAAGPDAPLFWHRPVNGAGGSAVAATSAFIPDRVSWLKSRRT
jgi:hypothetical protein